MFNNFINYAGVISLLQAVVQIIFNSMSIAQYFCAIDFLSNNGPSVLLKILYYINPDSCGSSVNIGNLIEGIPNLAFVLFRNEPVTSTRTYIISIISLVLGVIWAMTCCLMLAGRTRNLYPRALRWPWITVTVCVCAVDVIASVTYANDSFHTKSLGDMIVYIGATASGIGGATVSTSSTAWVMFLVYSRCVVMFAINVALMVLVVMAPNEIESLMKEVASPRPETYFIPVPPPLPRVTNSMYRIPDDVSIGSTVSKHIPRASLSQAYQRMKKTLLAPISVDKSRQKHEIAMELAQYNLETRADHQLKKRSEHLVEVELHHTNPRVEHKSDSPQNNPVELQPWSYTTTEPFHKRGFLPHLDIAGNHPCNRVRRIQ
ncbi:uncharacterized protein LOC123880272 isoform X2 [Maniola jurtina]|uniref:uncharacterized protein LOC123880272 isoform X2 n=1 Tax=Maniola jurtina TaxID=191418 RepID=UPI001E687D4E|nr:uncharacterized protein LOC123880272 isoform X2 [Maniola jurtina]